MKKVIFTLLLLSSLLLARPTSTENVVAGITPEGTFRKPAMLTDGSVTTVIEAKNIQEDNSIEITLPYRLYLRQIKLILDASAYPSFFSIERSIEPGNYILLKDKITPATYPKTDVGYEVTIPLNNEPAQRLRFVFPAGMVHGSAIRIAELEVYPNMDEWPEAQVVTASVVADTMAEIVVSSNVDFNGELLLSDAQGNVLKKIPTVFFTRRHAVLLHDLQPSTTYAVSMHFMDIHANISDSDVFTFTTKPKSIAAEALVTGTFSAEQPDDPHVVPTSNPLERVHDDNDSYFTSMVTSQDLSKSDQWIVFDFRKNIPIQNVTVFWRALAYSKDYSLEISTDGLTWKTIKKKLDAAYGEKLYSAKGDPLLVQSVDFSKLSARYVRITVAKGSKYFVVDERWKFVQIMEVKVF